VDGTTDTSPRRRTVAHDQQIVKHIDDTYAMEQYVLGYWRSRATNLERVAVQAGNEETAEVAQTNRAEEEAMARKIDQSFLRRARCGERACG
jgi:hypothetical protein